MNSSDDKLLDLELQISKLLRYGVLLAGFFLLIGWSSHIQFSGNPLAAFHEYHLQTLATSLREAWDQRLWGLLIAYAGIVCLICLPFLRVVMTAILFLKQGEHVLAVIAIFVLVTLIISIGLGLEV